QGINDIAVQPDGKIIIGGSFTTLGGGGTGVNARSYLGRVNPDGSLDASFNPGANNSVLSVCVQTDGKILVGGNFTTLGGGGTGTTTRNYIGRLNADGSLDTSFNPGANARVHVIATQRDGRILVGGDFTMLGVSGTTIRNYLGRLNADGSVDGGFLSGANQGVYSLAVQTDGKIVVGGAFTALSDAATGTTTRNRLGRFSADGALDASFDPGANSDVFAVAVQGDGKILAGGSFTTLGGGGTGLASRSNLGRVTNTDAALDSLTVTGGGASVIWARGGAGPEVWRVTFEASADGATYTLLGAGSRTSGGWQLGGLNLPLGDNLFIRARGFYATGAHGGSGSAVESIRRAYSAAPCTYTLSSSSASVPSGVNAGAVTLFTSDASCSWTAPNTAFVTVTSNSIGAGTTIITWVTAINSSASPRTAVVSIAGLAYTVTQAGVSATRRVRNDFNHDALSDIAVFRPSLGRWYIIDQVIADWGAPGDLPVPGDYNGDGNPEIAVFRPSNSTWYVSNGVTVVWGLPGDIPVPGDYNGDHVTDIAVFRPRTGQWLVRNVGTFAWGLAGDLPVAADYNGDGTTDIAVYRPSTGTWYVRNGSTTVYGLAADIPVPADYDGNGTADIAVFRPSSGTWFVMGQYIADWGASGDVPVPMDRSGDGIAELGVFHRATGVWQFKNHVSDTNESVLWGATGDLPLGGVVAPLTTLAGDFDGDRRADLTVYRPSTGDWLTLRTVNGFTDYTVHTFGLSTDTLVARDYDGDGKIDPAVYRPFTGRWFMLRSSTNFTDYISRDWGLDGDIPVPADYDGDGKADVAVFRPSLGRWLVLLSSTDNTSYLSQDFGLNGDIPVPGDYDGDGRADIAVFRPSTGQWFVYNRISGTYTVRNWGLSGDLPAAADFDGDGKADLTVYRPSLGRWYIRSTIDDTTITVDWGLSDDAIAPADYDGDGKADVAVYRPSNGDWYVRGQFHRNWGQAGDLPGIKVP
ncbi:MAG: FG-GAP-like repeat-containing protein, partial [Acidobacteriota bacterium]